MSVTLKDHSIILIVAIAIGFVGCGSPTGHISVGSGAVPATEGSHFFSSPESPSRCEHQCHSNSSRLALAALGIDPSLLSAIQFDESCTSILRQLKSLAPQVASEISETSVAALLDELSHLPVCSAALIHSSGHVYFVVGRASVGGEELIQVIHGDNSGVLVSRQQVLSGGFVAAWRFRPGRPSTVLRVGKGQLEVDALVKSLGLVQSGVAAATQFRMKNVGNIPLYLNRTQSSCSCTVADLPGPVSLSPGEEFKLAVSLKPNETASQRQYVTVDISDSPGGASIQQRLMLFAFQGEMLPVVPSAVDFETVTVGSTSQRTVRLREVESVRFNIRNVDVGNLPLTHSIATDFDSRGFATYTLTFELKPTVESIGKETGLCLISTSNRVQPEARVIVSYKAVPAMEVLPSTLTLGTVGVGQAKTDVLRFRAGAGEVITISDVKLPKECTHEITVGEGETKLTVTTVLTKPGLWQDNITLRANAKSAAREFTIRCSGLATKP